MKVTVSVKVRRSWGDVAVTGSVKGTIDWGNLEVAGSVKGKRGLCGGYYSGLGFKCT